MKTSWRCLSSSSSGDVFKTSSRHLDQDKYNRLGHTSSRCLQDVFEISSKSLQDEYIRLICTSSKEVLKMSSRHLDQYQYSRVGHTSSRYLQDVFKTSSRSLVKTSSHIFQTLSRRLQDIFKTISRPFEEVLKTSSRHPQDFLQRCNHVIFETYYQVKLFLLKRFQNIFETYSTRFWDVLIFYRRVFLGDTSEKLMVKHLEWRFFAKILNGFKLWTLFAKKIHRICLTGLKIGFWLMVWNIELTLIPRLQIKSRKYSVGKCVWHHFWKGEMAWWDSKQNECLSRNSHPKGSLKTMSREISKNSQTSGPKSRFW